jgi:hypothetical protein
MERALERVHALFLVERDREQDGFHGVVVALVSGRLRIEAGAPEEAVKKRLVFAPQGAAEFHPVVCRVLDELNECRNGAAHGIFLYATERGICRSGFSLASMSLPPSSTTNRDTWSACARSCAKKLLRGV